MLQSIRDKAQNWIFLVVIFLLVIAFAFFGFERFFEGSQSSKAVAKVNGYKITQNEFNNAYQRLKRQLQLQLGSGFNLTPTIEANLKKQALQQIIHNYVLTKALMADGFSITQGQINSVLTSLPIFQVNGQFSEARFQAVLNNLFYTETAFVSQLKTSMLINQLQLGLVNSTFVLPSEVDEAYALIHQKRDFSYLIIPANRFDSKIHPSEEQVKAYYDAHQQAFSTPEKVSIAYIQLSQADLLKQQKFSEAKLKQYYENNVDSFTIPARYHVAQIFVKLPAKATKDDISKAQAKVSKIERALKTESFDKVARAYSEDIFTARKGGVLPWFSKGMVQSVLYKTASALKVDSVSKPFNTKEGISIIKLLAKKTEKTADFASVKSRIENQLAQQAAEKDFATKSDELANLTFSDSNDLQSAAKSLNLKIHTTPLFTRKGLKTGIASNPKVVNAAFSDTVLKQNYNSDPISLKDASVIVVRVNKHVPASVKPLVEVKAQITQVLIHDQAAKAANQLGQNMISQSDSMSVLESLAQKHQLALQKRTMIPRHSGKVPAQILTFIFNQPNPNKKGFLVNGLTLSNGDYAVVALTRVIEGEAKDLPAGQAKIYREQLIKSQGELAFELYTKEKIQAAKIKHLQ